MDNLTLSLAALGGVVLAGLVAHGAWQSRKAGPRRASPIEPTLAAASASDPREPTFGEAPLDAAGDMLTDPDSGEAIEPLLVVKRPTTARLDALIDAIAAVSIDTPISGEMMLAHLPGTRRAGTKPFAIEGLNAETGEWEAPMAGRRYGEFQAGVQLANRTGALNEIEYSEFVQKVQAFADAIGAMPDFPDMLDVVARARELDGFAGQYDAQLAVHLRARSAAWSVGYIQQHGGRHGFLPGAVPGRLVLPSAEDGAPPVLTLGFDSQAALADDPNQSAVADVTLSFDVPQTESSSEPFIIWQAKAEALAADMDAAIVDDNGRPLEAASFEAIGGELGQLYDALQQRDLAAGSTAARRLFS